MIIDLPDADVTTRLGAALAPLLAPGDAVLLKGPLGMGKSTLARGLIRALTRPDEDVPSPTFTLVQFYESDPPIAHFDLYRLTRPEEAVEIGLDDALVDPDGAVTEVQDRSGIVAHKQQGSTLAERAQEAHAFLHEHAVANSQRLVYDHDVGIDMGNYRKGKPHIHAA